jgi:hypothetical protein
VSLENFLSAGVKAANPFVADADPNVTPPASARLYEIPDRTEHGRISRGVKLYAEYDTPSGAGQTLDGTVWVKDEAQDNFVKAIDFTALGEFEGIQVDNVAPGVIFVQFTAISSGTINNVNLFGSPLGE